MLIVWKDKASTFVFNRMKDFVEEYYIEPDKMTVSAAQSEAEEREAGDDLDECCPEEENCRTSATKSPRRRRGGQYNGY